MYEWYTTAKRGTDSEHRSTSYRTGPVDTDGRLTVSDRVSASSNSAEQSSAGLTKLTPRRTGKIKDFPARLRYAQSNSANRRFAGSM